MYKEKIWFSPIIIGLLFAFWFLIIPPVVGIVLIVLKYKDMKKYQTFWEKNRLGELVDLKVKIEELEDQIDNKQKVLQELEEVLKEYQPITDILEIKDQLAIKIETLRQEKSSIENETKKIRDEAALLKDDIEGMAFGFYTPRYGMETSEAYNIKLKEIRDKQKGMVKQKIATNHSLDWQIGGDKKRGKEFILDTIKLTLRAFNNECDNIIAKVKYSNVEASKDRIQKVFEQLNKLTDMQLVSITKDYRDLKIEELYLKYEFEVKKEEERLEQLEIKERMREEARALKELEKQKEKVEKEERHFEQAIEKLKKQMEETDEGKHAKLIEKLKELEKQLEETKKNKEDVLYRVQNTRAGYVYIISNIGSFGENIYKIGMTRRLEPMDRVRELGDASVPFTFDVHAMIFSEDAPTLENALHKAFTYKRVNKINERKEFFSVTLQEIEEVVKKNHNKTIEFTKLAEAAEYRQTLNVDREQKIIAG
ncbi:DUF4041 domain-containing protein [Ornithinibacillus californiensis]|uniref:DUF4041 domain-containing protein n=1 Tax=Ornithinibacillus californiensis TaxID=161536 RepID=UPI000AD43C11|nr:DUF4041 domain-containing protein [Ornithinibacillus californiensis]